ncbi:MAG TPA: 2-oxo-4-hydroxy-4-carboxy-5-ureidoimidazoline decarboxylase [Pyrinomonadaceae bacterium]|nr:2-oxo-4-hydroxy-4-carboxy-5-ureidoimidazoline decarboxylase [Pyrinomonadaceae bacterium]
MNMQEGLARLNSASAAEAESELLKCCGSTTWARRMEAHRPFGDAQELLSAADEIWQSLRENDWLEAFDAHPKIGGQKAAREQDAQAQNWSEQEQSGARSAAQETLDALAEANRAYEEKFGHIFIVCATGKSAAEMLDILRARLPNDARTELHNAAEEQRKITRLRLEKLLAT